MNNPVLQLYPLPGGERPLPELYLAHDLRQYATARGAPYVYANFVTSIDGRIAIERPGGRSLMVPRNVANPRDWRLYQELAAQSDLLLSSGRYLREWAKGEAQEILQLDDPRFADLRAWRTRRGLPPYPDLAIISKSLRFDLPDVLTEEGRKVVFFTTAHPDPERVREIEQTAGRVIVAGENRVEGAPLVARIRELGYRIVYSGAGPRILHLLLADGVLNRLYVTTVNRILAGETYSTLATGPLLDPAASFRTHAI